MYRNKMEKKNATDISKKFLNSYPNVKYFLTILMKDIDIETKRVGTKFQYPRSVIEHKHHSLYGLIIDYFIRKHLSNQFSIQLQDDSTEIILNNVDKYCTTQQNKNLVRDIGHHYKIFKDSKSQAMDIVHSVKKLALSKSLYFHDPIPLTEVEVNNTNLTAIINYFKTLPYSKAKIECDVGCKYFEGKADIIFDDEVFYEIKNSQFESLARYDKNIDVKVFYKMILYGFGYYKKTGRIIKRFKIYNPLLGLEYQIQLDDIDMELFESALNKDLGKF